jgi:hypothetical protein
MPGRARVRERVVPVRPVVRRQHPVRVRRGRDPQAAGHAGDAQVRLAAAVDVAPAVRLGRVPRAPAVLPQPGRDGQAEAEAGVSDPVLPGTGTFRTHTHNFGLWISELPRPVGLSNRK